MMTHSRFSTGLFAGFILFLGISAPQISLAQTSAFSRPLSIGSVGEDVRALQQVLNSDPLTQVQASGPGSRGQETAYFGDLTRQAVIRFQEKYRAEILIPNGLSQGTGYVGPATLKKIGEISSSSRTNDSTDVSLPAASSVPPRGYSPIAPTNPNFENLDQFLEGVERAARERGDSETQIAKMREGIIHGVSTTTDLRALFVKQFNEAQAAKLSKATPLERFFTKVLADFAGAFSSKANAQASDGIAFAGKITFTYPCLCSGNWLITMIPDVSLLMPTRVSYYMGTQMYLNFNLPFALLIWGNFQPGAGICIAEPELECAVNIPSDGLVSPTVGSF